MNKCEFCDLNIPEQVAFVSIRGAIICSWCFDLRNLSGSPCSSFFGKNLLHVANEIKECIKDNLPEGLAWSFARADLDDGATKIGEILTKVMGNK